MHFCFRLGCGTGLAAAALFAGSLPDQPVLHRTSVVRTDNRTGKLVRATVIASRTVPQQVIAPRVVDPVIPTEDPVEPPAPPVSNINEAVERIAAQHSLPPQLLHSVIKVESNYNSAAVSSAGALGLMQLIPSTARRFGVSDVFNPVQNIQGGARYLRYLLDLYRGDYPLALAAYNAGEGAVAKYGGVPPYRETQNYLGLVYRRLEESRREAFRQREKEKETKPAAVKAPGSPNSIREVVEADGTVRYISR